MTTLITADIHLNDNQREAHRWGLLPWLGEQAIKYHVNYLFILGDLTDAKDRHSAVLVNRMVDGFSRLLDRMQIFILKGNHDYIDPQWPFFDFIRHVEGISFFHKPVGDNLRIAGNRVPVLFLPSPKDWEQEWNSALEQVDNPLNSDEEFEYIFTHATFEGALSENGTHLHGISPSIFSRTKAKIWSGDIHTPQWISPVEYVGAPYHTRFGDHYEPRVVLIDEKGKAIDLHYPCPKKYVFVVGNLADLKKQAKALVREDQMKVRVKLRRSDYSEWPALRQEIRDYAEQRELLLVGPELQALTEPSAGREKLQNSFRNSEQILKDYGKIQRVSKDSLAVGLKLLQQEK